MRYGWACLAKGKCVGWEEERRPRTQPEIFPHWRLSRGEKLATESINEKLGRVLKPTAVNIPMFLKVKKDEV